MRVCWIVAVALLLTSCGATAAPPSHNAADVMFLQMLIPQNEQGIEIVRLAKDHDLDPALKELAAAIESTQKTEAESMRGWLKAWGEPEAMSTDPAAHAGHGGMRMTSPDLVAALKSAPDKDFPRKFLDILTGQQQGATELARAETGPDGGVNPEARDLARRVIDSRTAEVRQLLNFKA